jgi:hypothetical protein
MMIVYPFTVDCMKDWDGGCFEATSRDEVYKDDAFRSSTPLFLFLFFVLSPSFSLDRLLFTASRLLCVNLGDRHAT